jgi:O-antigen/teichoic acid export membrane protein
MKMNRIARSAVFGGLLDQGIVSLGNFALGVYLVRHMTASGYGAFSFVLSVIVFINTIHQAFVIYPLSVHAPCVKRDELDRLWATAAVSTLAEALVLVLVLTGASAAVGLVTMVPAAAAAMLFWQMQEVFRRGSLAQARFGAAIASDLTRYFGVAALVFVVGTLGPLTLPAVFGLIAATSAAGSYAFLAPAVRNYRSRQWRVTSELSSQLRMASPVIGANILAACSNQWFVWVLARSHGLSSSGALVALANIAAVASPIMFGFENIMVPEIARGREWFSSGAIRRLLLRRGGAACLLVAPFLVAIAVWPRQAAQLFYGQATEYAQFAWGLRLLAAAYALFVCSSVLGAALRGYSASRAVFIMHLYPALVGITIGTVLIWQYGVSGACFASLLTGLLRVAVAFYFVMQISELTAASEPAIVNSRTGN